MLSSRLPNYLRTHRKRTGLSQEEVAFLLGAKSSARVCRHEQFRQTPNLPTLLAYEVLFRTPISTLFGGARCEVEVSLKKRVSLLVRKLDKTGADRLTAQKIEVLRAIAEQPVPASRAVQELQ